MVWYGMRWGEMGPLIQKGDRLLSFRPIVPPPSRPLTKLSVSHLSFPSSPTFELVPVGLPCAAPPAPPSSVSAGASSRSAVVRAPRQRGQVGCARSNTVSMHLKGDGQS